MSTLIAWFHDRTGLCDADECRSSEASQCMSAIAKSLPGVIGFTFLVQLVTGFFLWTFYSPSAQTAWESVYYLQFKVPGGWLLRSVHHYAAQVLVALLLVYVLKLIFAGRYRAPREFVFWNALILAGLSLGLCLTGDLLSWDQNSYASTLVRVNFLNLLPGVGDDLFKLAAGGPAFGHLTLTRFFALHAGLLAPLFGGLLLLGRRFINRARESEGKSASCGCCCTHPIAKSVGCLAVLVVVLLLATQHEFGVPHGSPADPDPANAYAAARPEWSFRGLYELSNMFPGELKILPIFVIPSIVAVFFFAMPILGRGKQGHLVNVGATASMLVGIVVLSILSYQHDAHSPEQQAALAAGHAEALRVRQLADGPSGIPPAGALSLLRDDAKTQGPRLYAQHCAGCHNRTDADHEFVSETSSAPTLTEFGGREWIAGLLDRDRINGPDYYGDTTFKEGDMAEYVDGTMQELLDELSEEELDALVDCLARESQLDGPRAFDDDAVEGIEEDTMYLFEDFTCTTSGCHSFYNQGKLGDTVDLTGYASREWLLGIVSDPTHERFYGTKNDRMPAYDAVMTPQQIEMLVDWLRSDWYEPKIPARSASE